MSRRDFNAGAEAMAKIMTDDNIELDSVDDIDRLLDEAYEEHLSYMGRLRDLRDRARAIIRGRS